MKKIGAAAAMAAMTIVVAALCGVALADNGQAAKPDTPAAPPAAAANHDQNKPSKPESASSGQSQSQSEPAAKVYICHATGSKSNPYVLIHVSSHALPAHTGHQDGRDIVLGASPGTCPGASATAQVKGAEHSEASANGGQAESPSKQQDQQKSSEPEAKVYICHATGSDSNPYVLIHVSSHALPAHTRHQDGRDIVLGASPGTCPGASSTSNSEAASVQGVAGTSCTSDDDDQAKSHEDHGKGDDKNGVDRDQNAEAVKAKHEDNDDDTCSAAASSTSNTSQSNLSAVSASSSNTSSNTSVTESSMTSSNTASTSSNTTATSNAASVPASSVPVGENANAGVLGAVKALSTPAAPVLSAKPHANAGVLGTVAKLSNAATSGTLPFSGIRLWIFELVALGLIGLGVATRLVVRRRPN